MDKLIVALLAAISASPESSEPKRTSAEASGSSEEGRDTPGLLNRVLAWFGFAPPKEVFRGTPTATRQLGGLDVWVMKANGTRAERLTDDHGYHTPVFSPDGGELAVVHGERSVRVMRLSPKPVIVHSWILDDPPVGLVGWTEKGIGVLTGAGTVLALDPKRGTTTPIVSGLQPAEVDVLWTVSRACGTSLVDHAHQPGIAYSVHERYDVVVRSAELQGGTLITQRSARRFNLEPAFSHDCKRIVFVSKP